MRRVKISKIKLFQTITSMLLSEYPEFNFNFEVNDNFCRKVSDLFKNTKYGYTSHIKRLINENRKFKEYFKNNLKKYVKTSELSIEKLQNVITSFDNSMKPNSLKNEQFSDICRIMGMKNSLKNRKKM